MIVENEENYLSNNRSLIRFQCRDCHKNTTASSCRTATSEYQKTLLNKHFSSTLMCTRSPWSTLKIERCIGSIGCKMANPSREEGWTCSQKRCRIRTNSDDMRMALWTKRSFSLQAGDELDRKRTESPLHLRFCSPDRPHLEQPLLDTQTHTGFTRKLFEQKNFRKREETLR